MKIKKLIASILTFMMLFMNVPTNVFAETKGESIPLDITLVLDVSGSMNSTLNGGTTRMRVLKDSVCKLIDEFSDKNTNISDDNKQNRIAIVKFAGDKSDNVGNTTYSYGINHTQVVSDYVAVQDTNKGDLKAEVEKINACGTTNAPAAMELTEKLVNSSVNDVNRKNAKRVVVFVTDGVPSIGGAGFEDAAANSTIATANSIKKNAFIYSIGLSIDTDTTIVGDDGDGNWTTKEKFNAYLHGISSNYPNATAYDKLGDRLNGADYYKGVKSSSEAVGAFDEVIRLLSDMLFDLADYTKVNEAKAKVPSDLSIYTEKTVKILKDALNAVEEGKNITEQDAVDGYAVSIEQAIQNLQEKPADYTKVKAAISKAKSLKEDDYVDFSKVTEAIDAVVYKKGITEQKTVDGYAKAINKAINELVKRKVDYKVVEGKNSVFYKKSKQKISIRINHDFTKNVKVEVDDKEVDKGHYKVTKGSTIITFDNEYLNTLSVGTHNVKVIFGDGTASTNIIIKEQKSTNSNNNEDGNKEEPKKDDQTPTKQETVTPVVKEETKETVKTENKKEVKKVKTGDNVFAVEFVFLLVISLIGLIYLRKKENV